MILDPFYGVFAFGKSLSRWLNRALLLAEGAGAYLLVKSCPSLPLIDSDIRWVPVVVCIALSLLAMAVVNGIIRYFWNIVLAFVYGTTDAETILEGRARKARRRQDRYLRRVNRQSAGWTRAEIVGSRVLDDGNVLGSPSGFEEKAARGRKALAKL